MKKISVIGLGSVGTSVLNGMSKYHSTIGYDIDGRGDWQDIVNSEFTFICVPTNANRDDSLDMSLVHEVVDRLDKDNFKGTIVIKSTLYPYTMSLLQKEFQMLKLCYMPEYLREKDAQEWFDNPDRLVITEPKQISDPVLELFNWVEGSVPRITMRCLDAEIAKLAHNAYIATKVTFTCEVERLCILHDANAHNVMRSIWVDRRINNKSHLVPGLGGFDGKCVPKDTHALAKFDSDHESLFNTLKQRGSAEFVNNNLIYAKQKKSMRIRKDKTLLPRRIASFIGNLFLILILVSFVILAGIGISAIGWEDDSLPRGEAKFLDSSNNNSAGDIIFATDVLFNTTGTYTTSSHQCSSNGDGGNDCSTTYTDHIKYKSGGYWYFSYSNNLNACLNMSCDLIGEVQESGIIKVVDWRVVNE
jgi:UDPglucose 6-dehydrogenase